MELPVRPTRSEASVGGVQGEGSVRTVSVSHDTAASILEDPDRSSLKRLAWAYGCAKKGSEEERALGEILIARVMREAEAMQ